MKRGSSTNLFSGGLVMDLNPLITPNTVLTDALNATIITNNGNENVLLNDMGNGRVETAYLPEGYIPVGTCEFGDIIYVASYNPFINKCLLGCFPSPLRNIPSSLISDLHQQISIDEFLDIDPTSKNPTGKLKLTTLLKIVFDNNLTSGDKYIICANNIKDETYLTDLGNTSYLLNDFPKLYKIKIVSIENDGKIVELSSGIKWYEDSLYFLKDTPINNNNIDIDAWRSTVNSAYCIFTSKVSGKLALLIELELITGFSLTWDANTTAGNSIENKNTKLITLNYDIHWLLNWETNNNNVNPSGIILVNGNWVDKNPEISYKKLGKILKWVYPSEKLPKSWENNLNGIISYNNNAYHKEISRIYCPEKTLLTYENFKNLYDYDSLVNIKIQEALPVRASDISISSIIRNNDMYYVNPVYTELDTDEENKKEREKLLKELKTKANKKGKIIDLVSINLSDDIVNNTFKYPVRKHFNTFTFPIKLLFENQTESLLNISLFKYHYKIAPYMPYGVLEQFVSEGIIDFSKIGTKDIKLHTWKYYNLSGVSTLTWGFDAYTEPNHIISKISFEFYDINGKCAAMHFTDRESYNGTFTNYISFNTQSDLYLSNIDYRDELIIHPGLPIKKEELKVGDLYIRGKISEKTDNKQLWIELIKKDGKAIIETYTGNEDLGTDLLFTPDGGTLYPNLLYLVKIIVEYSSLDPLKNPIPSECLVDYRWFWTTEQFNEYYFLTLDFKNVNFNLSLNGILEFEPTTKWFSGQSSNEPEEVNSESNIVYKSQIQSIKSPGKNDYGNGNVLIKANAGLLNDYNTFNLFDSNICWIHADITLGKEYEGYNPELPSFKYSTTLPDDFDKEFILGAENKNQCHLSLSTKKLLEKKEKTVDDIIPPFDYPIEDRRKRITYVNSDYLVIQCSNDKESEDIEKVTEYELCLTRMDQIYYNGIPAIELNFDGAFKSNYLYTTKKLRKNFKTLKPFISEASKKSDELYYNLNVEDSSQELAYCTKTLALGFTNKAGESSLGSMAIINTVFTDKDGVPELDKYSKSTLESPQHTYSVHGDYSIPLNMVWENLDNGGKDRISSTFKFLFPYIYMHLDENTHMHAEYDGNSNLTISKNNSLTLNGGKQVLMTESYFGSISGISANGNINIGDPTKHGDTHGDSYFNDGVHHPGESVDRMKREDSAPVKYGDILYTFLTNSYYLTERTSSEDIDIIDTYVYLSPCSYYYKRDVILELYSHNDTSYVNLQDDIENRINTKDNYLILIHGIKFLNYCDRIIEKANITNDWYSKLRNSRNVVLKLNSFLGLFPFEMQFLYKEPKMNDLKETRVLLELGEGKTISNSDDVFNSSTIYCIENDTMIPLNNNHRFEGKLYNFNASSNLISNLSISNERLHLNGDLPYSGTYNVNLISSGNKTLINFSKNLTLFDNILKNG